ncbi:MAG TPA: hypothetical protein DCS93_09485 [Microscillaceae bacterium]|nr:hypothetical protein [Microscillaceae bacterium]
MESLSLTQMENLAIEPSKFSPQIDFDSTTGVLKITGASFMEHPLEFYAPVLLWLDQFSKIPHSQSTLKVHLSYFNSGSSGIIFDILQLLDNKAATSPVMVEWHVDPNDEEMLAEGEEFKDCFEKLEFNIIQN